MRTLLAVTAVLIAGTAAVRFLTRGLRGRLKDRLLGAMEACPPIAKMSALQQQNDEVIALLREQNELMRRRAPLDGVSVPQTA